MHQPLGKSETQQLDFPARVAGCARARGSERRGWVLLTTTGRVKREPELERVCGGLMAVQYAVV